MALASTPTLPSINSSWNLMGSGAMIQDDIGWAKVVERKRDIE